MQIIDLRAVMTKHLTKHSGTTLRMSRPLFAGSLFVQIVRLVQAVQFKFLSRYPCNRCKAEPPELFIVAGILILLL